MKPSFDEGPLPFLPNLAEPLQDSGLTVQGSGGGRVGVRSVVILPGLDLRGA